MDNDVGAEWVVTATNDDRADLLARQLEHDVAGLGRFISRSFSPYEPFRTGLRRLINLIGYTLSTWLEPLEIIHVFSNAVATESHWLFVSADSAEDVPELRSAGSCVGLGNEIQKCVSEAVRALFSECVQGNGAGGVILEVPFSAPGFPFGSFFLRFSSDLPSSAVLSRTAASLNSLRSIVRDHLYGRYDIADYTYLPSYQALGNKEVAILFCDLRNSTRVTEAARLDRSGRYTEMYLAFLRSLLDISGRIISVGGVGRIHQFMGDGFLATFGEHLTVDPPKRQQAACVLAILSAYLINRAFDKLRRTTVEHPLFAEFRRRHNLSLDFGLGIGINYGEVRFDLFGVTTVGSGDTAPRRGFLSWTAVGDQMNYTARLCGVASKAKALLDLDPAAGVADRSGFTAPIVVSQTVAHTSFSSMIPDCRVNDYPHLRVFFKGLGQSYPVFELPTGVMDTIGALACLRGIHGDRFYNALRAEVEAKTSEDYVNQQLRSSLDLL